jgi:hypothetical protein
MEAVVKKLHCYLKINMQEKAAFVACLNVVKNCKHIPFLENTYEIVKKYS